jgi:hypothetical protein
MRSDPVLVRNIDSWLNSCLLDLYGEGKSNPYQDIFVYLCWNLWDGLGVSRSQVIEETLKLLDKHIETEAKGEIINTVHLRKYEELRRAFLDVQAREDEFYHYGPGLFDGQVPVKPSNKLSRYDILRNQE